MQPLDFLVNAFGNALGNSIVSGLTPKPIGVTAEQFAEVAAEMDARTGALMERTGSQAYADAGRTLDQWEFERRIDDRIQLSAQAMNDKLDMQIQASVKAPHFEFEPEMDAVTRAEYAARGGRMVNMMAEQAALASSGRGGALMAGGVALPEMDHSSYVAPGIIADKYYRLSAAAEDGNNSWLSRGANLVGATALALPAMLEETSRAVLNIPYGAQRVGQDLAIAGLTDDPFTRNLSLLDAVSFGSQAFTAAGLFVPVGSATSSLRTGMASVQSTTEFAAARSTYDLTTAFRVEGTPNARMVIGDAGQVTISGDKTLFLNFGQPTRAEEFAARRISQGMEGVTIKEFSVPNSYVEQLRKTAVFESEVHLFPDAPIRVDTRFPDQFGLRPQHFNELQNAIVPNSGRMRP